MFNTKKNFRHKNFFSKLCRELIASNAKAIKLSTIDTGV